MVDVLFDLFSSHTDTLIDYMKGFIFLIDLHFDDRVTIFHFCLAYSSEVFQFKGCIGSVGDEFAQEYLVIAVQEFFNKWKDVFHRDVYISFHFYLVKR